MLSYIWPLALVVLSNVFYHICTKSVPDKTDAFASLTVTYLIAAAVSAVLYFALGRGENIFREFTKMNWVPFLLGVVIVGLEAGVIFAYKNGWQISTLTVVENVILTSALMAVGYFMYHERLTPSKIAGLAICVVGLYFINR